MRSRNILRASLVLALIVFALPAITPAKAAGAGVGAFYAGCGNFSVDVNVAGTGNDGNNLDKFRYLVVDGNGKKLYSEDASRPVGQNATSIVVNLSYDADGVFDGGPGKNPISFLVQDLDGNNNPGAWLFQATYDASCLTASGAPMFSGIFKPPTTLYGTITATTPLYQRPGKDQLTLSVAQGKEHLVIYRTLDKKWVSLFVGGNDIVWVPASSVAVNLALVALDPVRVDGGTLAPSTATARASGGATVTVNLRLRSAPTFTTNTLATIPSKTTVPVLGRNSTGIFLKVTYNGQIGWISARYTDLTTAQINALPVVE